MSRKKIDLSILVVVLIAGVFAARNAQAIGDWVHNRSYSPPTEVTELADAAGMSGKGRALFFRFEPQIVDNSVLADKCNDEKLGCTVGRNIYILQADSAAEKNRNIVTAAHEMLHVAWSRMSKQDISDVEPLLDNELKQPQDVKIVKELSGYSSEDYYNEAHSFIGSELGNLSPELEAHYAKYFSDRAKSIKALKLSPED